MNNPTIASSRGRLVLEDMPIPQMDDHEVLIRTEFSAVSVGTENTIRSSTSSSAVFQTALKRLDTLKKQGVTNSLKTFGRVWKSLQPLGYSLVGEVVAVGKHISGIEKGDKVVATGAGRAIHSRFVSVPASYVAKVSHITPELALTGVFTIGVNAFRKAQVTLGDRVAIVGGGLIGELCACACRAGGTVVDIVDVDSRVRERLKCEGHSVTERMESTYDAVIIATDTSKTLQSAIEHIVFRGRIVIVGYGELVVDRGLLEARQPVITCVNSYGDGANDLFYELCETDVLSHFNCDTARQNLLRAAFIAEKGDVPSFETLSYRDYSRIDAILRQKKVATVVIKWDG